MKILLADDHPMVRVGMRLLLKRWNEGATIVEAQDYLEVLKVCEQQDDIRLLIIDLMMPGLDKLGGLKNLLEKMPDAPLVIMSASEDQLHIRQTIRCGARGYLPKSCSEKVMFGALNLICAGGTYVPPELLGLPGDDPLESLEVTKHVGQLTRVGDTGMPSLTRRQQEVLSLLRPGKSDKEIARILDISVATVHTHINAIFKILDVKNRGEAVHVASQLGFSMDP